MTGSTQITLDISGMSCGHCVQAVRRALEAQPGVTVDEVGLGRATVHTDPGVTTPEAVARAVADAGYPTRVA